MLDLMPFRKCPLKGGDLRALREPPGEKRLAYGVPLFFADRRPRDLYLPDCLFIHHGSALIGNRAQKAAFARRCATSCLCVSRHAINRRNPSSSVIAASKPSSAFAFAGEPIRLRT